MPNDELYTLSLHDALPISMMFGRRQVGLAEGDGWEAVELPYEGERLALLVRELDRLPAVALDRKSTRLNSSHGYSSYAVFSSKKKRRLTETAKRLGASMTC